MPKTIEIDPFDKGSIASAIKELQDYKQWVLVKEKELRDRLACADRNIRSLSCRSVACSCAGRSVAGGNKKITLKKKHQKVLLCFIYRQPPAMLVENALASSIERSEMSFRA